MTLEGNLTARMVESKRDILKTQYVHNNSATARVFVFVRFFSEEASHGSEILCRNEHGASARATFHLLAREVRRVPFFAHNSQRR